MMTTGLRFAGKSLAAAIAATALSLPASTMAYQVTGTLFGDPRQASGENPTNLTVTVTVDIGDSAAGCTGLGNTCSHWTIDLTMEATHPNVKLQEFYFNAGQVGEESKFTDATFSNFDPGNWSISASPSPSGSGNWNPVFMFGADGTTDVTNSQSLSFNMTLADAKVFDTLGSTNDFLGSDPLRLSTTNAFPGEYQLGAKLQSLAETSGNCPNGCNADSGFAVGNFTSGTTPTEDPPNQVPEPNTLALLGLGLLGLRFARRRKLV